MDKEQREFATATSGPCRPSCSAAEQPAVATDKLIAVEAAALGTLIAILKTVEGLRLETCKSRCAAVASLTAI